MFIITLFYSQYDLLHISPPQSAPTFLQQSSGITDAAGFVDVNKGTLVHNKYSNVFALGDCSSLPTAKTAAAVGKWLFTPKKVLTPKHF